MKLAAVMPFARRAGSTSDRLLLDNLSSCCNKRRDRRLRRRSPLPPHHSGGRNRIKKNMLSLRSWMLVLAMTTIMSEPTKPATTSATGKTAGPFSPIGAMLEKTKRPQFFELLKKMRDVGKLPEPQRNATRRTMNSDMQKLLGDEIYQSEWHAVRLPRERHPLCCSPTPTSLASLLESRGCRVPRGARGNDTEEDWRACCQGQGQGSRQREREGSRSNRA